MKAKIKKLLEEKTSPAGHLFLKSISRRNKNLAYTRQWVNPYRGRRVPYLSQVVDNTAR